MNLNLSFSIFTHPAMDASSTMAPRQRHLMRTGTEFISEISTASIFPTFNFHIFRFSGKGEVDVYRVCMCFPGGGTPIRNRRGCSSSRLGV